MDYLISAIEQWEQDYQHYKDRTTEVLSDSMRKACLQSMCPSDLSNHIDLNIVRLDTYDDLKREIERYVEQVVARNGPAPMDIGTFSTGDSKGESKGKDKGKGKGKSYHSSWSSTSGPAGGGKATGKGQFQGDCSRCGMWGHKKVDCYAKTDSYGNPIVEKPTYTAKGKRGGLKGKGKGEPKGGVREFAEEPESGEYGRHPPGQQEKEGDVGIFFTLTEDDPASTSSQDEVTEPASSSSQGNVARLISDIEKKTA
jgi:hypothetical protein